MSKKLSLFHYFHWISFALFFTFAIMFFSASFYDIEKKFDKDVSTLQKDFIENEKTELTKAVDYFLQQIEELRKNAYGMAERVTEERGNEAYAVAMELFQKNHGKMSDAQLQERIIETLRMLKFDHGNGYYFILKLDGTLLLTGAGTQMEGKNLLTDASAEQQAGVRNIIECIKLNTQGHFEYSWNKPNSTDAHHPKISYFRLFEPFNWMIGTGAYKEDIEHMVQHQILNNEAQLLYKKEEGGYYFLGTFDGIGLSYPAKYKDVHDIQDMNGKYFVQELIDTAKNGGGFVEYKIASPDAKEIKTKLSYVKAFDEWQWYVGAGMYLENVKQEAEHFDALMYTEVKRTFVLFALWTLLFVVCLLAMYVFVNRRLRKDFKTFIAFFDSLTTKEQFIDTSALKFREFEEMAEHANAMLSAKMSSKKYLERYKKIVSSSDDYLALIDKNYTYLAISEAYLRFFNKPKQEIIGHSVPELFGQQYFDDFLKEHCDRVLGGETFESEYWVVTPFGRRFVHSKYYPYYENDDDAMPAAYVIAARDNTEKKANEDRLIASEKELEFLAHNDTLTGLPNRLLLNDRIAHAIEHSKRQTTMLAVCFIDLDNFKKINDSYGHSYGDAILKQFSTRVQETIRECDTLSRIGGDEFVLLIENVTYKNEVERVLEHVQAIFEEPFIYKKQKFFLSSSIGVSLYPEHGSSGEVLIKNADTAMYKAKDAGKNTYMFYTLDMTVASYERVSMEIALREAIKEEQFRVHYQPQVDLKTGQLIGLEALIRWEHPKEGLLSPWRFISYAEETRLIIEIGSWILKQACLDWKALNEEGLFSGTVSVNISGVQIEFSDFLATLSSVICEVNIEPTVIEMEVTESFIMQDPERWISLLKRMQEFGVRIAIDDFGTGYSSLSYLRKLPINKLKVDMSFVRDIPEEEDACSIVNSIITLAKSMKMETIAEGIETKAQQTYLAEHGCEQGQGYLYAKPMSLDHLREWIRKRT